jgi:hypothetical protein
MCTCCTLFAISICCSLQHATGLKTATGLNIAISLAVCHPFRASTEVRGMVKRDSADAKQHMHN